MCGHNATVCSPTAGLFCDSKHRRCLSQPLAHRPSSCLRCAPGMAQDQAGQSTCKNCFAGKHSAEAGQVDCLDCLPGKVAASSSQILCQDCLRGSYQGLPGGSSCTRCPAGWSNLGDRATSCIKCSPGRFASEMGSVMCAECGPGTFQSGSNASRCLPVLKGYYRSGATTQVQCAAGKYGLGGSRLCRDCAPGSFQAHAANDSCTLCPKGYASQLPASVACTRCAPGSFADRRGRKICKTCPHGWMQYEAGHWQCDRANPGQIVLGGGSSAVDVPLGSFKICKGSECNAFAACPAGYKGQNPPGTECFACGAGQSSFPGSTLCNECEKGKFAPREKSPNCTRCEKSVGEYADVTGSTSCKICPAGYLSTVTDACGAVAFDDTLPVPRNVTLRRPNTSSWNRMVVSWDCRPGYAFFRITISSTAEFSKGTVASFDGIRETSFEVPTIDDKDMRRTVNFIKVQSVGRDYQLSRDSAITLAWRSTDRQACVSNALFLDVSPLNPFEWECKPCPEGGDCSRSLTWNEVVRKFGWWRIPRFERDPQTGEVFVPCLFAPACLGAPNPALFERYPEARMNTPPDNISCAVELGFRPSSRLCHACAPSFRRSGPNRCSRCPDGDGASAGLMLLGFFVTAAVLAFMVRDAIGSAGSHELSAAVQKIFLNYV